MSEKEKRDAIVLAVIFIVLFLLWNFWRGRNTAPKTVQETAQALDEVPGLSFPNISFQIPPLTYTPNPYGPVIYNPGGVTGLNLGRGCALCLDMGDNILLPPTGSYNG